MGDRLTFSQWFPAIADAEFSGLPGLGTHHPRGPAAESIQSPRDWLSLSLARFAIPSGLSMGRGNAAEVGSGDGVRKPL